MKLDPTVMRTMERTDFRVLAAVETGMQDHYLVPLPLVHSLAGLRHGGSHKIVSTLLRDKLLSHERKGGTDGYRLTNAGYDILALHNLKSRGFVAAMGQKIGTGKESDVYLAADREGRQIVLKFHRLGRTSFRNVRKKRDYFNCKSQQSQQAHSWLFLSRLSALKEFAFMKALHEAKYPTPIPIAHNRHIVAMSLVRGVPLYQIFPKQLSVAQAADIYEQSIGLASRLASIHGLVHCDLNEFNLLVDLSGIQALATDDGHDPYVRHSGQSVAPEQSVGALSKPAWEQTLEEEHNARQNGADEPLPEPAQRLASTGEPKPIVTLIDFPQMISTQHPNAQDYYERDISCLRRFFEKKLQCQIPDDDVATQQAAWENIAASSTGPHERLDENLRASGYTDIVNNHELELYYFESGPQPITSVIHDEEPVDCNEEDDDDDDDDDENSNEGDDANSQVEPVIDVPDHDSLDDDDDDDDNQSRMTRNTEARLENLSLLESAELQSLTRSKLEELAKARVRRQMEEQRRKSRKKGALRKGNSSKSFVKGKRVFSESLDVGF